MAQIVISDSSVLMDLAVGRLLEAILTLPYEFVIPDVMLEQELIDLDGYDSTMLCGMGFQSGELTNAQAAFDLFAEHRKDVGINDCFALAMAEQTKGILMTGDRGLRRVSRDRGVEVRGTLWVTAELATLDTVNAARLLDGLEQIKQHPRTRLPQQDLDRQIVALRQRVEQV